MKGAGIPETAGLVAAAQAGDPEAWAQLVREFQDVAMGLALGATGSVEEARDVVQDGFLLAYSRLSALLEPAAFPGWFAQVIRTAAARRTRRPRVAVAEPGHTAGVDDDVVDRAEAARVRAAIEALPAHERSVVALHYVGGLSYPAVAELLGISPAAAKKRAFSGRNRMKEGLSVTADAFATVRPSRARGLSARVALFLAIRRGDEGTVRRLVEGDPTLLAVVERWTPEESMALGLQNAESGTPLVRAAGTGNAAMVQILLDAGASVDQTCACLGGESALWTAVQLGHGDIVGLLLAAGAGPDLAAFGAVTPLILAAQRGDHRMVDRLVAAGADIDAVDASGRTAGDWLTLAREQHVAVRSGPFVSTGVRAIDLFAPVRHGSVQLWPPAWEVGGSALLHEVVRGIGADTFWQIGFETGPYDPTSADAMLRQLGMSARVRLTPSVLDPAEARADFFGALQEARRSPGSKVVVLVTSSGHHHDTTLAAAQLAFDPGVITTFVLVAELPPYADGSVELPAARTSSSKVPEGYDAQVSFDPWRAERHLWPAVDPRFTRARRYPNADHEALATAARTHLDAMQERDPTLAAVDEGPERDLIRYLVQPFSGWEFLTGRPGESTSMMDTLAVVTDLVREIDLTQKDRGPRASEAAPSAEAK